MPPDPAPAELAARLRALTHEPSTDAGDDPNRRRRVGLSRAEMMTQGDAVARTLAEGAAACAAVAEALGRRRLRRAVIAGCGDSWLAGIGVRLAWETMLGIPVEPAQALDHAAYSVALADEETLVVGISASGNTAAVTAVLDQARERGAFTVGVSNAPGSPRMAGYDASLTVQATRRGWPTQSSTATMALLCALAAAVAGQRGSCGEADLAGLQAGLAALPGLLDATVARLDGPAQEVAEALHRASLLLFLGAGPHFGAAAIGAAKVREFGPVHALAMPLEEFHHYRLQKPGDPLFLLAPDAASFPRALDAALVGEARGGRTVALLPDGERSIAAHVERTLFLPPVSAALAPIVYSVPLHLVAWHFAQARFARGLGYPGAFT